MKLLTNRRKTVFGPLLFVLLAASFAIAAPRQASVQPARTVKDDSKVSPPKIRYVTPLPPYPFQALQRRLEGVCTVRVQFNAQGNVASVVVVKSAGSEVLDGSTTNWIKQKWRSLDSKPSVYTKDMVYSLSHRTVG